MKLIKKLRAARYQRQLKQALPVLELLDKCAKRDLKQISTVIGGKERLNRLRLKFLYRRGLVSGSYSMFRGARRFELYWITRDGQLALYRMVKP